MIFLTVKGKFRIVNEQEMIQADNHWRERVIELLALLEEVKPLLVAAEAQLSERLAAVSAFEFQVRAKLEGLTQRLERLEEEIKLLRRRLNLLQDDWLFEDQFSGDDLYEQWRTTEEAGAAASGNFRYRETPEQNSTPSLSSDQKTAIKRLYRQLARRFHPDFALDDEDRAYRTGIMMAVNAAYNAGDLEQLEELALEPDPQQPSYTDAELAEALLKEWHRCWRRMREIEVELARLEEHPSAHLINQAEKFAEGGRDFLGELAEELREKIAHKMIQRDMLKDDIESFSELNSDVAGDKFADAVYDLGLEDVLVEDPDLAFIEWRDKNWGKYNFDDDYDEESDQSVWEELRKRRR